MGGRAYRIWKLLCEGMEQKIQAPSRTGEVTRYFFFVWGGVGYKQEVWVGICRW